jgi:hypothetical protein
MARHGYAECRPERNEPEPTEAPLIGLSSGYVLRAQHLFPKQGPRTPWKLYQNYALDLLALGYGRLEDGVMKFSRPARPAEQSRKVA